jgi:O-antigen/teichoic acid export membrane protein
MSIFDLNKIGLNIVSNIGFQISNVLIQIALPPILIHFWGLDYYGEWLIIYAISGILSNTEFGFATAATTELSVLKSQSKNNEVKLLFRSVFWFIFILTSFLTFLFGLLVIANISKFNFKILNTQSSIEIVIVVMLYSMVSVIASLPNGIYRVLNIYHIDRVFNIVFKLIETIIIILSVYFRAEIFLVFMYLFSFKLIQFGVIYYDISRRFAYISILPFQVDLRLIKPLIQPSFAMFGIQLFQALNVQGVTIAIGSVLSPASVVVFNSSRTLINFLKQIPSLMNLSYWTEFSHKFGLGNFSEINALYKKLFRLNLSLTLVGVLFLSIFGESIFRLWLGSASIYESHFFNILLLSAFFGAISSTSSTLLYSVNLHGRFSIYYVFLTSFLLLSIGIVSSQFQLLGVGYLLVVFELFLLFLVFIEVRRLFNFRNF